MKNTRRAAAAWMTMSLAVSTVLGNTAWGDVLQETGKNRCVHVHTAECYGDADETATMSQTGELEPTECTHVCSVESGCILDTENLENNDADAWKVGTPSNADQKDTEDGGVVSVSTPSNAEDTTINPGGTVTPAVQTKILSWSWFDPEENLLDGKLELTGITEEAQPSFTEVTEYLPQAIIAQVGEGEDWEEKNLQITNWVCTEYVQDEEGRWPLEGTYEFKAELEEGYELADGVDALVVEVSVVGDQTAVTATSILSIYEASYGVNYGAQKSLEWTGGNNYSGSLTTMSGWGSAIRVTNTGDDNFTLELTNANIGNIYIPCGHWTIVLNGDNNLDGKGSGAGGIGLLVWGGDVTIKGGMSPASLTINGYPKSDVNDGSCGIEVMSSLTIESGNIITSVSRRKTHNEASGAIYVASTGTLNINGGSVTAKGDGRFGLSARGNVNMSDGEFKIIGINKVAVDHMGESTFTLVGGTITITSPTGHTGLGTKGNLTIKGGTMNVNILEIAPGVTTTVEGGTLETGGIKIGDNGKLVNEANGTLIANGNFEGNGTIVNTGTISGSGNVPDGVRRNPGDVGIRNSTLERNYSEEKIDVQSAAGVTAPNQYVKLFYSIDESESTGIGTIDSEIGELTVKKAGIFKIKVKTLATGVYIEGTPAEITLTVNKADFPNDWNLTVNAVKKMYDGKEVAPATITDSNIPKNVNASYQYQLATEKNATLLEDNWKSSLTIKDVVDSEKYVFVRVVTDNYAPRVFVSADTTEIKKRTFSSSVTVTIEPDALIYNGKPQMPKIKVVENWDGALKNELRENVDYKISYWGKKVSGGICSEIKDSEIKDAGTYTVQLMGIGNYDNTTNGAIFTIQKSTLFLKINGSTTKVYDGTVGVTDAQNLAIQLAITKEGTSPFDEIYVDHVEWEYNYADAGKRVLTAHDIKIAGPNAESYQLESTSVSDYGWIEKRDFASMTVSAAPLTYNGTEQQPKINASVETGLENVSPDATFTYSKDGVNYQSEIPGFTEAGTYLVYVKASMANFNDETKTVAVTVQKAAAPTVSAMSESYSYKETGERQVALPGFPEDCGTIGSITAQIISDEGQILDSAAVDGMNLVLRLKGSSKNMVGKTAQVVVKVETKNYEDIQIPVIVTLTADPSDSNSNNNSGNNSGNNGSSNGNSNGGNNSGSNGGSSSSDRDRSDRDDSNASVVKVSPGQSGKVTKDSQKGYRNEEQGVITGANNQAVNDGYSHWMKDAKGWWLRYSDGTWPMGRTGAYHWEKINGRWWAFGADGYISSGWIYDTIYQGWFYMDENQGMLTGWQFINGKWYYLNPNSDGTAGIMYTKRRTPDGWYVKEDGSWDEEAGR